MSLQKYEIFLRTLETGSVSRAAEDLGLTQSAVSHALTSLVSKLTTDNVLEGPAVQLE